jgi:hypothetical protein
MESHLTPENGTPGEPDKSRLWDEQEAAHFLHLSVEYLQVDRVTKRRIPFIKFGRAVRYDPEDVIAYKNRCKVSAG